VQAGLDRATLMAMATAARWALRGGRQQQQRQRPLSAALGRLAGAMARVAAPRAGMMRISMAAPLHGAGSLRAFTTVRQGVEGSAGADGTGARDESAPEWEWIPPSKAHDALQDEALEQIEREEDLAAAISVESRAERRKRIEQWTLEADKFLDGDDGLIKTIPGVPLTSDEVAAALRAHRAEDVVCIQAESKTFHVIATVRSPPHMRKILEVMRKSARARRLKLPNRPRPRSGQDDWVSLDLHKVVVHIMSKSGREYYDLEPLLDPNQVDVKLEELERERRAELIEEDPKHYS